ncbi:MFS transporter [Streptomyces sp. NPDC090025]|uniref:MFS transporter n=1 Tax=Streptomyces sp. NPDC090025 TaxID=3365922 RepID=UPI0038396C5D
MSAFGSWLAFNALPLLAIRELHAGPAQVAALASVGAAVGAVLAVPLGPWVEFRRKRPVMVAMDLLRCAALLSVPAAYALGLLGFAQLMVVSVAVAAAGIGFDAASGAYLKSLLGPDELLIANGRLESTSWTATLAGPPLGGVLVGLLGPVVTVVVDAVSYLLSALGLRAIRAPEPPPEPRPKAPAGGRDGARRARRRELVEGWRHILGDPVLRPLFWHTILVNSLILATEPLLAVLLLQRLGYPTWQYGLAFALPCVGGLVGARLARPLAARLGRHRVLVAAGALRTVFPVGLAVVGPGTTGLVAVMAVEFGLIFCSAVFNPLFATLRLERTPRHLVARTLSAWAVSRRAVMALLTAGCGLLAGVVGVRGGLAVIGVALLATPLLLPRRATVAAAGQGAEQAAEPNARRAERSGAAAD